MKFILHSVSYSPTWKGQTALSLDRVVAKAAQLGYDGIELIAKRPHASPLDLGADARKRLKETILAKGLELACIAGYQDFSTGLEHPDMPHFEKELLYLRETVRLAHDLGCRIVRIYSGFLRPHIPYEDQWNWCVQYIREGAKFAEDLGVFEEAAAVEAGDEVGLGQEMVVDPVALVAARQARRVGPRHPQVRGRCRHTPHDGRLARPRRSRHDDQPPGQLIPHSAPARESAPTRPWRPPPVRTRRDRRLSTRWC